MDRNDPRGGDFSPEEPDDNPFSQMCIRAEGHEPPCNGLPRETCPTLDNPKGGRHEAPRDAGTARDDAGATGRRSTRPPGDDLTMGECGSPDPAPGDSSTRSLPSALPEAEEVGDALDRHAQNCDTTALLGCSLCIIWLNREASKLEQRAPRVKS